MPTMDIRNVDKSENLKVSASIPSKLNRKVSVSKYRTTHSRDRCQYFPRKDYNTYETLDNPAFRILQNDLFRKYYYNLRRVYSI